MVNPLVSVLIPVYNAGKYFRPSVQSILEQSYQNLEIIIIDDGSTDGCVDSIQDLKDKRTRILRQANAGKPVALNKGLDAMSGEFYAIHDADDLSYPNRIERQVRCMQEHVMLGGLLTGWDIILNERRVAPRFKLKTTSECRQDIQDLRMPAHDPTAMYRVSLVKDLRYDPTMPIVEGFDYILQVGEKFPLMVLGECLYSYRIHPNSLMQTNSTRTQELAQKVLDRAARRRGTQLEPGLIYPPESRRRWAEYGLVSHFMESVLDLRRTGRAARAVATAFECLRLHPLDKLYYKPLVYSLVPQKLINRYRSRKMTSREKGAL